MKIQLEPTTFRIPVTEDWKTCEDKEWRESPTKDVWEHETSGEQLFTWDAAMRETKNVGKRLPTDEELEGMEPKDFTGLLVGSRSTDGSFGNRGSLTGVWSSSDFGGDAWTRYLHSGDSTVYRGAYSKAYGFSARCVLEKNTDSLLLTT